MGLGFCWNLHFNGLSLVHIQHSFYQTCLIQALSIFINFLQTSFQIISQLIDVDHLCRDFFQYPFEYSNTKILLSFILRMYFLASNNPVFGIKILNQLTISHFSASKLRSIEFYSVFFQMLAQTRFDNSNSILAAYSTHAI